MLGGFYVLHALGAGAVGSVFVARRGEERTLEDAELFALKVAEYGGTVARTLGEAEFFQMFRDEAGALLAVPSHPNLARLVTFDAGARPKPILVMELVEGPTLERIIETGSLDMPRAIHTMLGVASGLEAMHSAGVGHLDLKPSNVILRDPDGDGPAPEMPVLVDFGLAGRKVRPGCATASYGAPEVWGLTPKGHVAQPSAADVYAFGCLVYEMLHGMELFRPARDRRDDAGRRAAPSGRVAASNAAARSPEEDRHHRGPRRDLASRTPLAPAPMAARFGDVIPPSHPRLTFLGSGRAATL
jgi:serine/threonine protein kinase